MCTREKDEKRLLYDRNINLAHKCFTTRVQSEEIFQILFTAKILVEFQSSHASDEKLK